MIYRNEGRLGMDKTPVGSSHSFKYDVREVPNEERPLDPGHYLLSIRGAGYLLQRISDADGVYGDGEGEFRLPGLLAFCERTAVAADAATDRHIAEAEAED